jgi:CDP-glucose 4,6-dehydratase
LQNQAQKNDGKFWDDRTAFVTGATGFVGAHVVRSLLERGAKVICLQRDEVRSSSLDVFRLRERVTVINGTVGDLTLLERILNEYEVEAVFHLAAQALVGAANRSPLSTFETNIRGTYLLLEACRLSETVKRIVVASSDKAYGSHAELPYREDFALRGLYPYDVSKACTDMLAQSFARTYNLPVTITRSANIYGAGDLNLSRIIPGTIVSVLKNEQPIIRSDGTPVRDFVFVDDLARGCLLLAERIVDAAGEAFNFGSNEPVQMLELVARIVRLMGREEQLPPKVLLRTKIEREIDAQYLSAEKVYQTIGWKPEVDLNEGLRRTIEWYRANLDHIL